MDDVYRPPPPELLEFLDSLGDEVPQIAIGLRRQVLTVMPHMHEFVWDATNAVSNVFTPSTRWQDGICHIASYSRHANLGFNDGAGLDDPRGILVGSGARIRHVSFRTIEAVEAAWVREYLEAALARAGMRADAGDRGTTVRVSTGPKRRPRS